MHVSPRSIIQEFRAQQLVMTPSPIISGRYVLDINSYMCISDIHCSSRPE